MATITTTNECPTCKAAGKTVRLSENLITGELSCGKHKFTAEQIDGAGEQLEASVEETPTLRASAAPTAEPEEDFRPPDALRAPADAAAPRETAVEPAIELAKPKPLFSPPPVVRPSLVASATLADPNTAPAAPATMKPEVLGKLPGNNMKVMLIVPELHWIGVVAEAEIQRQDPIEYLQAAFERGLDNRWLY